MPVPRPRRKNGAVTSCPKDTAGAELHKRSAEAIGFDRHARLGRTGHEETTTWCGLSERRVSVRKQTALLSGSYAKLFKSGNGMRHPGCSMPSNSGDATTMRSGHMPRSAIERLHPRSLFRRLPRGRLRNFNQLRRARFCCTCDQT